ncbi:MAG: oxidoreductase [Nanoarchaeota archaeon]|nr:oxidoreductase [Nanoarchaeota archaeon]|tara:strand:- start:814 stop:1551 length:738 start_codon:yes stop_codon:yes gene_type:complete
MPDYNLKVSELIELSPTAKAVRFELNGQPFLFTPGQFIMLQVDLEKSGKFKVNSGKPKIQKRAFSMSSSPTEENFIEVTVKTTEEAFFSDYLVNYLEEGEEFLIKGPFGQFYFNENETKKNVMLIGAGSGISPLMSILRFIDSKNLDVNSHIIFCNKTESEILWRDEIEKLSEKENISHTFTLTREEWDGEKGRVNKEMIGNNLVDANETDFYLCGPPLFVKDIEKMLVLELDVPKENIKKEVYD